MKSQSLLFLVIGLAVGGGAVYFTSSQSGSEESSHNLTDKEITELLEELDDFNNVVDLDVSLIEEMQQLNRDFDSTAGKFLKQPEAGQRWRSFRDWNTRRWNFRKEIKPNGFAFGIQKLRNMLISIDKENERLRDTNNIDSLIHGVRLNLSHTPSGNKVYIDAMFVPIIKGGYNYIDMEKDITPEKRLDNDIILNTSVPCPTVCGSAK